ncbi:ribosomal-protein-alanine acetyltransferase [Fictibacillus macauensis ZFHKF-1]|uniref:Ribosomal-protein-alanine acetyltransferase n=1 Tax=Fictibacillus macauensis ZFHKF-1 TaxID=1196324 RepID=I8UD23_9BACL|nr:GNAT family N-acetyltransferase [Fictibacillus macauensis]EIT84703.1 ribosomal-protein-alanine acetyltransferase [Fictibacillus macauensis ZFHKF-1]
MQNYSYQTTPPTLEEYKYLCDAVGWTDSMNFEAAEQSLQNSLYSYTVYYEKQIIGMGRIVGDGAIYFYIQDVVVHPAYQGQGIGKEIMNSLMTYLQQKAPNQAFVGLFASEGKEAFYEKYHFKNYTPTMTGMFTVISK